MAKTANKLVTPCIKARMFSTKPTMRAGHASDLTLKKAACLGKGNISVEISNRARPEIRLLTTLEPDEVAQLILWLQKL